jgi:hypothetical protein
MIMLAACGSQPAGGASTVSADDGSAPATAGTPDGSNGTAAAAAAAPPRKDFVPLDYLQKIPVAYRVSHDHPEVLEKIACYCPCELYGHTGVVDCYRSQHAAACATCLEEAVVAGQLIEQHGAGDPAAIAAQVNSRYRAAIVRNYAQNGQFPNLRSEGGGAYLQACSACHQPPHPGMYSPDEWKRSLARMEAYGRQRNLEPDPVVWQRAVDYLRANAGQFTAPDRERYRESLATAVEHLKVTEGAAVYYPTAQDPTLDPAWFERMVRAYRLARDIPAEVLAATPLDDPSSDCSNLLDCLNSIAGVTSEAAVEAVEAIAAGADDD